MDDPYSGETYDVIHTRFIDALKVNPLPLYKDFSERLRQYGNNAEFPEFAPVVHKLKLELHSDEVNRLCDEQFMFSTLRNDVDLQLASVSLSVSWYPYASTIRAISMAVLFFDVKCRAEQHAAHPEVKYMPYHAFRYLHYLEKLLDSTTSVIIFPTWLGLGATNMMKQFGTAIYIVGINFQSQFIDEFTQTPMEFFFHDINHIRRFRDNSEKRYALWAQAGNLSPDAPGSRYNYYEGQRGCIAKLMTLLGSRSPINKNVQKMVKFILFEILHEEAEPALESVVCESILREPAKAYSTGFMDFVKNESTGALELAPVVTPSASLLSFVKYKLWYGFYDTTNDPKDYIAPLEARKIEVIAEAAMAILKHLRCKDWDTDELDEKIIGLVSSNTGLQAPVHDSVFHVKEHEYRSTVDDNKKSSAFTGVRPEVQNSIDFARPIWTTMIKATVAELGQMKPINKNYIAGAGGGVHNKRRSTKQQRGGNGPHTNSIEEENIVRTQGARAFQIDGNKPEGLDGGEGQKIKRGAKKGGQVEKRKGK